MYIRVHRSLVIEIPHNAAGNAHTLRGNELREVADEEVLWLEMQTAEVLRRNQRSVTEITCTAKQR